MSENMYVSVLAPWIEGFIAEKRAMGYKYQAEEYDLAKFDKYWAEANGESQIVDRDALQGWIEQRATEGKSRQESRVCLVRQFTRYLKGLGVDCWIPDTVIRVPRAVARVLSPAEVKSLFEVIDSYVPDSTYPPDQRMAKSYPIFFRLLLATGLRRGEACNLRLEDVNLETRRLTILGAKGHKDRLVYFPDDMAFPLDRYIRSVLDSLGETPWLFPGRDPEKHMNDSQLAAKFKRFWEATPHAGEGGKVPTPHSLRHTFTVFRINQWAREGRDVQALMPYLSKHLGHSSPGETYYYYHAIYEGLAEIRRHDPAFASLFPEVKPR